MSKLTRSVILEGDAAELAREENEFWRRFGDKIVADSIDRVFRPAGSRYSHAYVSITFIMSTSEYSFDEEIKKFYRDMGYEKYDPRESSE